MKMPHCQPKKPIQIHEVSYNMENGVLVHFRAEKLDLIFKLLDLFADGVTIESITFKNNEHHKITDSRKKKRD